jgi:hypothetical protein
MLSCGKDVHDANALTTISFRHMSVVEVRFDSHFYAERMTIRRTVRKKISSMSKYDLVKRDQIQTGDVEGSFQL